MTCHLRATSSDPRPTHNNQTQSITNQKKNQTLNRPLVIQQNAKILFLGLDNAGKTVSTHKPNTQPSQSSQWHQQGSTRSRLISHLLCRVRLCCTCSRTTGSLRSSLRFTRVSQVQSSGLAWPGLAWPSSLSSPTSANHSRGWESFSLGGARYRLSQVHYLRPRRSPAG